MSTFEVKVTKIKAIEPIEGADFIELAVVGDYRSVVKKGEFKAEDLVVYIPEASLVPLSVLHLMGLEGKLAGPEKNRVKAAKFRGCLSQGILYPVYVGGLTQDFYVQGIEECDRVYVFEGDDVAEFLGITKYEPPIPTHMSGDVYGAGLDVTVSYDIENYKKYPDVLQDGEEVIFTEKIHGTLCGVGILPKKDWDEKHYKNKFVVFSKKLGAGGRCFKESEKTLTNVYFRALIKHEIFDLLEKIEADDPVFVLGEVYGTNIQDLTYGFVEHTQRLQSDDHLGFRVFDICTGYRSYQKYFNVDFLLGFCETINLPTVPLLYRGPFSKEIMLTYTQGLETVSGHNVHLREGIVIKPVVERYENNLGRVILKSISEAYLLRKGKTTEFN